MYPPPLLVVLKTPCFQEQGGPGVCLALGGQLGLGLPSAPPPWHSETEAARQPPPARFRPCPPSTSPGSELRCPPANVLPTFPVGVPRGRHWKAFIRSDRESDSYHRATSVTSSEPVLNPGRLAL